MSRSVACDKGFSLSPSFSLSANISFRAHARKRERERERRGRRSIFRELPLYRCLGKGQVVRARLKHASLEATLAPAIRDPTNRKASLLFSCLPAKARTISPSNRSLRFLEAHASRKLFFVSSRKSLLFKITDTFYSLENHSLLSVIFEYLEISFDRSSRTSTRLPCTYVRTYTYTRTHIYIQ